MKRVLLLLIVGIIGFGLGWWANEMNRFANGVIVDSKRIDSLKKANPFFFLNDSCGQKLSNKQYWSPDQFTGGFHSITLRLNESGKMFLIDSTSIQDSANEAGVIYNWKIDTTARGNWCVRDKFIFCRFFNDKKFIEKTFFVPDFSTGKITSELSIIEFPTVLNFPTQTDSLIIRGIPCVLDKK